MKRKILVLLAVALCTAGMFTGCKEKLKQSRGIVSGIERRGDTLVSMRVVVDGDTTVFNLDNAEFNRGIALQGDSVLVNHLKGHGDTLRAIIVTVMPRPVRYFRPDSTSSKPLTVSDDSVNKKLEY